MTKILSEPRPPFTLFSLLTHAYIVRYGISTQDAALVALKNHCNAVANQNGRRRRVRSLKKVLAGKPVSGSLTSLQCCPVGECVGSIAFKPGPEFDTGFCNPYRADRTNPFHPTPPAEYKD